MSASSLNIVHLFALRFCFFPLYLI